MTIYVGLTDDAARRKAEHRNPPDWQQTEFSSEADARAWEHSRLSRPGCRGGPGGAGWRFGYWYTITSFTKQ